MIFPKNLTAMLTRVQNLTTMLVTTVLHRTVFWLRFILSKERKTESIKSTKLKTIHTNKCTLL